MASRQMTIPRVITFSSSLKVWRTIQHHQQPLSRPAAYIALNEKPKPSRQRSKALLCLQVHTSTMAASAVAVARSNLKDNLNSHWKNDKTGFGFRMLSKMGWSEGKGLGKNEDGKSSHIIVSKKTDALGLGCDKDTIGNSGWSSSIQSFTDVLAQLNAKYGSAEKDSKKKKKKSTKKTLTLSGKRVMYSKMTKAKDISNYTADEKAKVLGLMNAAGSTETGSSSSDKSGSKKKRKKESKSKRKAQEEEADESTETDSVSNSSTDEKNSEKKPSKKKKKTKMTVNGQQQEQTTAARKTMEKKKKKKAKTTRSDGH